jgi:hypothetical protein
MSLRHALGDPNCNTIDIAVQGTISLTSPLPIIDRDLTITGPGTTALTIQRDPSAPAFRIFEIAYLRTVSIRFLTIANGRADDGGGLLNNGGALSLTAVAFNGNTAGNGLGGLGGAIYNKGLLAAGNCSFSTNNANIAGGAIYSNLGNTATTVTVTDSTFSGNTAYAGGGIGCGFCTLSVADSTFSGNSAALDGGGIGTSDATVTVTGSTFSRNSANASYGGGVYHRNGTLALTNSTFFGNSAFLSGGGILTDAAASLTLRNNTFSGNNVETGAGGAIAYATPISDLLTLTNNIFANSSRGGNCRIDFPSPLPPGGNLSTDDTCPADFHTTDPLLGPLADNGRFTQTMSPLQGSPILDSTVAANCPQADQRHVTRPQRNGCDIGAFEAIVSFTCPSASSQAGAFYSSGLTGYGGFGPYFYSIAAGSLPDGLTLNQQTGSITGTPRAAGTSSFTVRAADSTSSPYSVATNTCSISTVNALPSAICPFINTVQGVPVTIGNGPLSGAGGAGGPYTFSASGLPDALTMASNGSISGAPAASGTFSYTITVRDSGNNTGTVNCSLNVMPAAMTAQTITVTTPAPASAAYSTSFTVAATGGGSGNPVTYSSAGACTNSGPTFTITAATGTCSVLYNQAGNSSYSAAPLTTNFTTATKANQTITFTTPAPASAGYNSSFTVAAASNSGLPVALSIDPSSAAVCSLTASTVTLLSGTGTCTINGNQSGDGNYNPAAQRQTSAAASKVNQETLTLNAGSPLTYQASEALSTSGGTGSGAVTFAVTSGACSVSAGQLTANSGSGSCVVGATKAGDSNFNETTASATVTLQKASQTITFAPPTSPATYGTTFNVAATSSSTLAVSIAATGGCSITNGAVTMTSGATACTLTASQTGDNNYSAATEVVRAVNAAKASQTITFAQPTSPATYGTTFNVAATSSSTLAVSIAATGGCSITNGAVTMTSGTTACTLTASQTGDNNYSAAAEVVRAVNAAKASQTITFAQPTSPATYGMTFNAAATSSSGLAVSVAATGGCSVNSGAVIMTSGTTACTLTAKQTGTTNYLAADDVIRAVQAAKANLTVTADPKTNLYLAALPALTAQYSGFKGGDTPAVLSGALSCVTTATQASPIGSYAITCSGRSSANYNISYAGSQLTVLPLPLAATVTLSSASPQHSDKTTINVSIPNAGGVAPALGMNFKIGSVDLGTAALSANGVNYTGSVTSPQLMQAPGLYTVTATFVTSDLDYALSYTPSPLSLTIMPEDARSIYTGPAYINTPSVTSYVATIPLSFTIQDITAVGPYLAGTATTPASGDQAYDAWKGNINNSTVKIIDGLTNTTMCASTTLGVISAGDTSKVTASCSFTASLPTTGATAGFQTYAPRVVVSGSYVDRNSVSEEGLLSVALPLASNFVSAGGQIVESASAGLLPGAFGTKANFSLNVKYNKSGSNLQGNAHVIFRSTVAAPGDTCPADANGYHVYELKSNSLTSLTTQTISTTKAATLVAGANIQDITATGASTCSYSVDGGATLQITMTDPGNSGNGLIGITIWEAPNKGGDLWFSSNWLGGKTTELSLGNGKVSVR